MVGPNIMLDTTVVHPLDDEEATRATNVYVGSEEQSVIYHTPTPPYAVAICDLVSSMRPASVLEFGCNGGRNLALLRPNLPDARLVGIDINAKNIKRGREIFDGLDLSVGGVDDLAALPDDSFDVVLSVSVADHMPFPERALRNMLRVSKEYLVLYEPTHDRLGKGNMNCYTTDAGLVSKPVFRYSYLHDYRYELETKLDAPCLLDVKFPIGDYSTLDLYHLYVFTKKKSTVCFLNQITWKPIS